MFLSAGALALLLLRGQAVAAGVRQGLSSLGLALIPALFPFLILSEWLTQSGAGEALTRPFCGLLARATGLSRAAASVFLLGLVCGTPVGCLGAAALWRSGAISREDRERLLLFSNNPGVGFMAGVAGRVCGDVRLGLALWALVTLAALTACILSRFLYGKAAQSENIPRNGAENARFDLPVCIGAATTNMVRIAGFYLAGSALLGGLNDLLKKLPPLACAGAKGLLELSAGVLAAGALTPRAAFLCCAFLSGFAGLTIGLQLRSLAGEAAPPLPLYLAARLFVGALTLLFARAFLLFAAIPQRAAAPAFSDLANKSGTSFLPLWPLALLLLLYILTRRTRQRRSRQK